MTEHAEARVEFGSDLHGLLQDGGRRGAVLLSHGAGRGLDTPLLVDAAGRLAALGFCCLRWNFSYIDRRSAPSAGSKRERAELAEAADWLADRGPLIMLGKSFGARVSTHVAAGRQDVAALAFLGLPLHGLAKGAKPRDWTHLSAISAPLLFVTGDGDRLCSLDHLQEVQKLLRAPFTSTVVPGDHSFKPHSEAVAVELAVSWLDQHFPA